MKRLLLLPIIIGVLLFASTPVFADDPPDMDVDVGIVTPGDVDLDIGINANGDVDVTVDGVDFKRAANMAELAYDRSNSYAGGAINSDDWKMLWNRYASPLFDTLNSHDNVLMLLSVAQAKMIKEKQLTDNQTTQIISDLDSLEKALALSIQAARQEDERIMNQLVYGAETHVVANQMSIEHNQADISYSINRLTELQQQIDVLNQYNIEQNDWIAKEFGKLNNWVSNLQAYIQTLLVIISAIFVGIIACLLVMFRRIRYG